MLYTNIISILETILVTVPGLLIVAFVTVAERKTMASMQRRLGPNLVGYYGLLQAFADALKLLLKEYVSPTQSNFILFFLGPVITLIFSLLSFAVIPYACGLTLLDLDLGILYALAVSSLATYGILLAGWSANSKYAFLGSLRSTAQLVSYELILSSAIFIIILLTGSLNLTSNLEYQKAVWFIFPLAPLFIVFFISSVAETNRAPFDLAEAESELVSGFMTEHAAVIFVFFFLAEYASIVIICVLTSILFLGGPFIPGSFLYFFIYCIHFLSVINCYFCYIFTTFAYLWYFIKINFYTILDIPFDTNNLLAKAFKVMDVFYEPYPSLQSLIDLFTVYPSNSYISSTTTTLIIGLKSCVMIFIFIWVRASLPRVRFDQLMSFCWTVLLPIVVAFIFLVPCILYGFDIYPSNTIFV